jgi:hypothetical protein
MQSVKNDRSGERNRLRYILAGIILATSLLLPGLVALSLHLAGRCRLPRPTPSLTLTSELSPPPV